MGAMILAETPKGSGKADHAVHVIDGQQRLATVFLCFVAIAEIYLENEGYEGNAIDIVEEELILKDKFEPVYDCNLTFLPAKDDMSEVHHVFNNLYLKLKDRTSSKIEYKKLPQHPPGPEAKSRVVKNYKLIKKEFNNWVETESSGIDYLNDVLFIIRERITAVQIYLLNILDGPEVYDRLNSKSAKLDLGELIKNDIFFRLDASDLNNLVELNDNHYEPFIQRFGKYVNNPPNKIVEDYFFPYVLAAVDNSVAKKDAYLKLQENWDAQNKKPIGIIHDLESFQDDYLDIAFATGLRGHPEEIKKSIQRLIDLEQPTSLYPFTMRVSHELYKKNLSAMEAKRALEVVESFLVRRAVLRVGSTGLKELFKMLWAHQEIAVKDGRFNVEEDTFAGRVRSVMNYHKTTHEWPNDKEFKEAINSKAMPSIKRFLLMEWERHFKHLNKEILDNLAGEFQVEHILPQTIDNKNCWIDDWTKEEHESYVDTLGNLTLLTGPENSSASNDCWHDKRTVYDNSAVGEASIVLSKKKNWRPQEVQNRSKEMANWALKRWPY